MTAGQTTNMKLPPRNDSQLCSVLILSTLINCFQPTSSDEPSEHQSADIVRDQLVNIVEHLSAEEPDIFPRSW